MSREWEGEGYWDDPVKETLAYGRWESHMRSCFGSKRGKKYLKDFIEALEAMPEKELIDGALAVPTYEAVNPLKIREDTSKEIAGVCAIGAYALHKGVKPEVLLDEPESSFSTIEVAISLGMTQVMAWAIGECNDYKSSLSPKQRWEFVHEWAIQTLQAGKYVDPWRINLVFST